MVFEKEISFRSLILPFAQIEFVAKCTIGSLTHSLHIADEQQHPPPLKGKFYPRFSTLSEK